MRPVPRAPRSDLRPRRHSPRRVAGDASASRARRISGATASSCPSTASRAPGMTSGFTPLDPGGAARRRARDARALPEGRLRQSSDPLLQGPCRARRRDARPRAGLQRLRLRVDREPRQQRRRARRAARPRLLRLHSRGPSSPERSWDRRSAAPTSLPSTGTTTTSTASARRSASAMDGLSRTSTCARTTPRGPRRTASRSSSSSAGGSRATSSVPSRGARCSRASSRGFDDLLDAGLMDGGPPRIHAAQAAGCAPVIHALDAGLEYPEPVRPDTIAKSIAIGNPADGFHVLRTVRESGRQRGGGDRRGDHRRDRTAGADRGHLHGAGRRHHAGGHPQARRRRGSSRGTRAPSSASPETDTRRPTPMAPSLAAPTALGRSLAEFEAFMAERQQAHQPVSG